MCGQCDWRERERARFIDGTYKLVPWAREDWWYFAVRQNDALYPEGSKECGVIVGFAREHFAHVSNQDKTQIAFTQSPEHGARDRQTRMKPGRYLQRYFAGVLSEADVRRWSGVWATDNEDIEVAFATEADDIQRVYENGPNSCMSHAADDYNSPFHPVRVYAAGDVSIVYLKRGDEITARAVCWPEKKLYGRVYGDENRLHDAMKKGGFTHDSCALVGARLLRHAYNGGFVLPYLDGAQWVTDRGEFLIVGTRGDILADSTDGVVDNRRACECCGDRYDEDNLTYTEVYDGVLCERCHSDHVSYCGECESEVSSANCQYIESADHSVCDVCVRENFAWCDKCNAYHSDSKVQNDLQNHNICDTCREGGHGVWEEDDEEDEDTYTPSPTINDPNQLNLPLVVPPTIPVVPGCRFNRTNMTWEVEA